MRITAALLFLAYLACGPHVAKGQRGPADTSKDNSAKNSKPVPPMRIVIEDPLPTIHAKIESSDPQRNAHEKAKPDWFGPEWISVYVAAFYALIAALTLGAIWKQASLMESQIKEIKDQAAFTKAQSESQAAATSAQIDALGRQANALDAQSAALGTQVNHMEEAGKKTERIIANMEATSIQQLRAWVVGDLGSALNVANPVPMYDGQIFDPPSAAQISNLAAGPAAIIQIKNVGQTPAFHVEHWGEICFREFPLLTALPSRPASTSIARSMLGPGIISTKLLQLNPALTEEQVVSLRAGTGAVYVYGEISYKDAFKISRLTTYRLMYHMMGGAIGVNTSLSFCDDGNDAT